MYNDRDMRNRSDADLLITPGTDVYDVNGDKVGTVHEYNPQAACLVVQKGFIFTRDIYVPTSTIARNESGRIYLDLSKDDLKDERFSTWPVAATTTTSDVIERANEVRSAESQTAQDRDINVPVREEELTVDKQRREVGQAQVHKETIEEQQSLNVPVSHERVTVERVPVDKDQPAGATAESWQDKDIVMPVMGEEVVAEKRPYVKEEIHIHKQPVTETERVSDTVRKERVEVEGVDEQGELFDRNATEDRDINR